MFLKSLNRSRGDRSLQGLIHKYYITETTAIIASQLSHVIYRGTISDL